MKRTRILQRGIAALLLTAPGVFAAPNIFTASDSSWDSPFNWSLNALPGIGDNAVINATGSIDVNGDVLSGLTEIRDLTLDDPSGVTLKNEGSASAMDLVLNGGRGAAVPLIQTLGNAPYTIQGLGTNNQALRIVLKASGSIDVGSSDPAQALTISSVIAESGGARSLRKTGSGRVILSGANTFTGGVTISEGIWEVRGKPALGTGAVTLNGGTLQVRDNGTSSSQTLNYGNAVVVGAGGGTINVDRVSANISNRIQFGTLSIGAETLNFVAANNYEVRFNGAATLTGNATFNVGSGGTSPMQVYFNSAVGGAFDFNKAGVGTVRLLGANTYSGQTNVNAGTLAVQGAGSINSSPRINVAAGATFQVSGVTGGYKLAGTQTLAGAGTVNGTTTTLPGAKLQPGGTTGVGNLTMTAVNFGSVAGDLSSVNFASLLNSPKLIISTAGGLVTNGGANSVTINLGGGAPAIGTYPLIDYSGTIGGTGAAAFQLGTIPARITASLVSNVANTSIDLNVTGIDFPIWKGALSTEWNATTQAAPKNWVLNSNNATTTDFLTDDNATFNDLATQTTVNIGTTDVSPGAVVFANVTKDYTITGTKAITGIGGLTKSGAGKVTISNTNTFLGPVTLNGGTVSVATIGDSGEAGGLGAGNSIAINGGGLEYTGPSATTNRAITVGASGATITITNSLTLTGALSGTGAVTVNTGTLGFNQAGAISITNAFSGTGGLEFSGGGTFTLSGILANSYTGPTTISSATLIAGRGAGTTAIPGDLRILSGGTFRYAGNNVSNQIANTASILVDGGVFGDPFTTAPTDPGATDTVANVTVMNGGQFASGRNVVPGPFTITGTLHVLTNGIALAQRAGIISANAVIIEDGFVNLDGGSGTANAQSRLDVGSGGLTLVGGTVTFNAGPSGVGGGSQGSIVRLGGDVTSTGTSRFVRNNGTISNALVDLLGGIRGFNVADTLEIGADNAPINITNGGIQKSGDGNLAIVGSPVLSALDIQDGTVTLGAINPSFIAPAPAGLAAVPEPGSWSLLCLGASALFARRRRR